MCFRFPARDSFLRGSRGKLGEEEAPQIRRALQSFGPKFIDCEAETSQRRGRIPNSSPHRGLQRGIVKRFKNTDADTVDFGCSQLHGRAQRIAIIIPGEDLEQQPHVGDGSPHRTRHCDPCCASDGRYPINEMRPGVGFNPAMPQKWAGTRMEPPPSLPTPPGEHPLAMAAASPPEEPPGVRSTFQGLFDRPVR